MYRWKVYCWARSVLFVCLIICSPSTGYSPSQPGYSPSSTSQYTPQTSDKDDGGTRWGKLTALLKRKFMTKSFYLIRWSIYDLNSSEILHWRNVDWKKFLILLHLLLLVQNCEMRVYLAKVLVVAGNYQISRNPHILMKICC